MPDAGPFTLHPLPYAYDALEPVVGAETMRLHHDGHHKAYVDGVNGILSEHPQLQGKTIEQLLSHLDDAPESARLNLRNQGGGHANHQLFWKVMRAPDETGRPSGALAQAIDTDFGSFDDFKARFERAGAAHFGSGWVVLVTDQHGGRLDIMTFANQDSPLEVGRPALLLNDLWEHAYYLQHQNRRPEYLRAWWPLVDWPYIEKRLNAIRAGHPESLGGQEK